MDAGFKPHVRFETEIEGEKKNRDELSGHMVRYAGCSEINRSFRS